MKKITLFILLLFLCNFAMSQNKEKQKVEKRISSWLIDEELSIVDSVDVDTLHLNFPQKNIIEHYSILNLYNGNYGSPLQTAIYHKKVEKSDFVFANNYKPYIQDISNNVFYDSTIPYTNLTYLTGGRTGRREEQIKFKFTGGPSEKINIGLNLDYLHSVGQYNNQAAKRFAGNIFGRYTGKHYNAYAFLGMNNHANHENGGLSDLSLLTNKNVQVKPQDMPTMLAAYSKFKKNQFYYNHSYSIGINREVKVNEDTTRIEYIPFTKFGHILKLEDLQKRYYEPTTVKNFYKHTYDSISKQTNDSAAMRSITNIVSISIAEEFNKWLKFGLTAFAKNEVQQFAYRSLDSIITQQTINSTKVGATLSKTQGSVLRYKLIGTLGVLGYKLGEYKLSGEAEGNFKIGKEPIVITASAISFSKEPSFFIKKYYSNHFRWENDFRKTFVSRIGGSLEFPKRYTQIQLQIENTTNHIYFNENGLPKQHDGNVQVLSLDLNQDIRFGAFTFENNIVYQLSSKQSLVPLPMLSFYHNLYYHDKWFKDLYPQLGTSVRYHTAYYAQAYMPATGQFYNQSKVKIGNYPMLDVYANFHLKQARFFIKYTNLAALFMDGYGMHIPNYAFNPPMLKIGLSWNFYD